MARFVPSIAMMFASLLTTPGCVAIGSDSKLLHDALAVHDMSLLRRGPAVEGRTWVVLRILPDAESGAALPNGSVMTRGNWLRMSPANESAVPESGSYEWTERQKTHERRPQPSGFYSPFTDGGVVLCAYRGDTEGAARFDPVFLLPDGWVAAATSLLQRWKRPAEQLTSSRLVSDASGGDPIAAAMAYRRLLELGELKAELLRSGLTSHSETSSAVVTYLALTTPVGESRASVLDTVEKAIRAARNPREWDGIALGTFSAELFVGHQIDRDTPAHLLRLIKGRATATAGQADARLAGMLQVFGW